MKSVLNKYFLRMDEYEERIIRNDDKNKIFELPFPYIKLNFTRRSLTHRIHAEGDYVSLDVNLKCLLHITL